MNEALGLWIGTPYTLFVLSLGDQKLMRNELVHQGVLRIKTVQKQIELSSLKKFFAFESSFLDSL